MQQEFEQLALEEEAKKRSIFNEEGEVCIERLLKIRERSKKNLRNSNN